VEAVVRNPDRRLPKCSSIRNESRVMRLLNQDVAEGKESTEEHLYNHPHKPRPSNPSRTVK
jgi:hypothetical protein